VSARAKRCVDEERAALRLERRDDLVEKNRDVRLGFNRPFSPNSRLTTHDS
jgi:hypothetical protein